MLSQKIATIICGRDSLLLLVKYCGFLFSLSILSFTRTYHCHAGISDYFDFRDSVPHVNDSTLDKGKVVDIIHNVTEELISAFPNTSIFPSFGNHDPYPTNQMPIDDRDYYLSILESSRWDQLLPAGSNTTFLKGKYC